jgi:hypothetical protein
MQRFPTFAVFASSSMRAAVSETPARTLPGLASRTLHTCPRRRARAPVTHPSHCRGTRLSLMALLSISGVLHVIRPTGQVWLALTRLLPGPRSPWARLVG